MTINNSGFSTSSIFSTVGNPTYSDPEFICNLIYKRSSLHCRLQRHDISRLPNLKRNRRQKEKFKEYPIGFFTLTSSNLESSRENPSFRGNGLHFQICYGKAL